MKGKNIIIGVSAGIAAYKIASLTRLFIASGANVQIVMTPMSKEFITPLTLATLSKRPVMVDFYNPENGDWNSHVDIGLWADVMIVAPATANTIAKMAHGIADNLLLTTYLSAKCPVFFAPTMDLDMYNHPATQQNIKILKERGNRCIDAESGELASGLIGKGRMAEPEEIFRQIDQFFNRSQTFENKTILITAGPTYESIDPVRFIGNYSTGKMGYALAKEFIRRGAKVVLISGPVAIKHPKGAEIYKVISANEMYEECIRHFSECDIAIMCAAVADFTPTVHHESKVKREKENLTIELKPTLDIASKLGEMKKKDQILVGFALETDHEYENAWKKLKKKNLDFIVLNSLNDPGAGFGHDTNKISIIDENNIITKFELKSKKEIASDIIDELTKYIEIENY
jgi:phosphopantothenoylcysteine decarboxylase / phosphopantothenate---cysteine ligase